MATHQVKYAIEGSVLTITAEGQEPIVFDTSSIHPDLHTAVFVHGAKQKVGDQAALGKDSTIEDKFTAMRDMVSRLQNGQWRETREGSGPRVGKTVRAFVRIIERGGDLAKALRKHLGLGRDVEANLPNVQTAFSGLAEETRKVLMGAAEVKSELAQMDLEAAQQSGTSLLG